MSKNPQIKRLAAWSIIFIAVVSIFVLIADEASARAGGGHSYSGGGGGHSSSGSGRSGSRSGGGGGDAQLFLFLIRLIFAYPVVGIPLTILIIFLIAKGYSTGSDQYVDYTINRANKINPESVAKATLTQLKQRDPGFDEKIFAERANQAFRIIQQAWSDRNLDKAQTFLSDGIYEQFSIQIAEMREKGIIDHLEGLQILQTYAVKFQSDKNFDVIHLRINARAVNYRKDEKSGKILNGSRSAEEFAEVWSFMRKPGAKTLKKPSLLEGQCPNCGNPIKIGRLSKCDICNALLRSGEYDWVLTSITQACEWSTRPDRAIPGIDAFSQADPGFNMQHIKERVAVMFWRKIEAERIGKIEPLRKIARDEYCEAQTQWLKADNSGVRRFYTSCAVGGIDLLGMELSEPNDIALVEVVWSGIPSLQKPGGSIEPSGNPINFRHVFVIGRRHGAQTRLESAMASSHCPACGAPEQTSSQNECSYCGSVMNDGKQEWVLEAVADRQDGQVSTILKRISPAPQRAQPANKARPAQTADKPSAGTPAAETSVSGIELLRWTVAMMLADGEIDTREMDLIKTLSRQRDINEARLQQVITELQAATNPVDHVMQTSQIEADQQLMRQIARVALADGKLTSDERKMLDSVGKKLGMTSAETDMLLTRERNSLYKEAKDLLRQSKK